MPFVRDRWVETAGGARMLSRGSHGRSNRCLRNGGRTESPFLAISRVGMQMHELEQIHAAFEQLCADGKPAALATVVAVSGSSYRRPGARMLVAEDGRTWGGVSGGCLERDVARRGRGVIATGIPVLARYDTAEDADSAYVAPPGCRGVIDVFVQPLSADSPGPVPQFARVVAERRAAKLATVLRTWGPTRLVPGTSIAESQTADAPEPAENGLALRGILAAELAGRSTADAATIRRFDHPSGSGGGRAGGFVGAGRPPPAPGDF